MSRLRSVRSIDARTTVAAILWPGGTALALIGNWLHWEWLARPAPTPYPDQIWGDLASSGVENALVILELVLGITALVLWRMTSASKRFPPGSTKRARLALAGLIIKWLTVAVAAGALIEIAVLLGNYMSSWWMLFPGWLAEWFAQVCIFLGALALPSFVGPHRMRERERQRPAVIASVAVLVVAILLPYPVAKLVTGTQVQFEGDANSALPLTMQTAEREPPWGAAGVQAVDDEGTAVWERMWRGARDPLLFPSTGGGTGAVQLLQATLARPSLVLLDAQSGAVKAQMTPASMDFLNVDLTVSPDTGKAVFTYGDVLLRAGMGHEWISGDGERLPGPPSSYTDRARAQRRGTEGVHALNMVTGESWFVGDGAGCARRAAIAGDMPVAADGVLVMFQVCDEEARSDPWWSYPDELNATVAPLTGTLFGVDQLDGSIVWTAPLPGFAEWRDQMGSLYPSTRLREMPLQLSQDQGTLTVQMQGVTSKFAIDSGGPL